MTIENEHSDTSINPVLYWISGSPPSWRVMLALLLKEVEYNEVQLNYRQNENRKPAYLRLNPKGQVPTFTHSGVAIRESIAILAYIERAFEGPSLFGASPKEYALSWQTIMELENELRPVASKIASTLLREHASMDSHEFSEAVDAFVNWVKALNEKECLHDWIISPKPSVVDCWLYPTLAWIERAMKITEKIYPAALNNVFESESRVTNWMKTMESLDGFENTYPPHWRCS